MWLIIGGSGFIGVNLVHFLAKQNIDFKIYDVKKSPYLKENYCFIKGDIRDKEKLSSSMKGCDVVVHIATVPPAVKLSKSKIYDIDVNGTRNVIDCAHKNNIKRIVFTSSASHVYGIVENDKCPITEDTTPHPINEYGKNKVIAEKVCENLSNKYDMNIIILRLSMVLGPYNKDPILKENIVSLLHNKQVVLPGDGDSKNQSIYVEDVNDAIYLSAMISSDQISNCEIFNISGHEVLSMNDFVNIVKKHSNSKSNIIHLPLWIVKPLSSILWFLGKTNVHPSYLNLIAHDQILDIERAEKILDFKPRYSVEHGLIESIRFIKR